MKDNNTQRTCPICGQIYTERPACSRSDGSMICPDCGTREALQSIGVDSDEQNKILDLIHSSNGRR